MTTNEKALAKEKAADLFDNLDTIKMFVFYETEKDKKGDNHSAYCMAMTAWDYYINDLMDTAEYRGKVSDLCEKLKKDFYNVASVLSCLPPRGDYYDFRRKYIDMGLEKDLEELKKFWGLNNEES